MDILILVILFGCLFFMDPIYIIPPKDQFDHSK